MDLPPNESWNISSYIDFDEDVDYGSDINLHGDEETFYNPYVPNVRPLSALNPLVDRGKTNAPTAQNHATFAGEKIIYNPFEEQQELISRR